MTSSTASRSRWRERADDILYQVNARSAFSADTIEPQPLSPGQVRAVPVDFDVTEAMANGVALLIGSLDAPVGPFDTFEECVDRMSEEPSIDDPEAFCAWLEEQEGSTASSGLSAITWVRQTDAQDGWTKAQAQEWLAKSNLRQGGSTMANTQRNPQDNRPAGTGAEDATALRAELDQERQARTAAEAALAQNKRAEVEAALVARLAAVKHGDAQIAEAHAKRLAELAMDIPDDKREAHVAATIEAIEKGLVPIGEIGGTSPGQPGDISPALIAAAKSYGLTEDQLRRAAQQAG